MRIVIVGGIILFVLAGVVLMCCVRAGAKADEDIRKMWYREDK